MKCTVTENVFATLCHKILVKLTKSILAPELSTSKCKALLQEEIKLKQQLNNTNIQYGPREKYNQIPILMHSTTCKYQALFPKGHLNNYTFIRIILNFKYKK